MIASTQNNVQVSGNLQGDVIAFDFDADSLPQLQSILINMYGDPELAVIREIACNGRDATIEAGSKRPIEVTTPTPLSPFLSIRDFGCGLDRQAVEDVFCKYGASTKRETNTQTGCLGIGSKSPLAYAPQFTVTSIKGGKRLEMVVSLDDLGAAQMQVVTEEPTTEENGTEVIVPAKRFNSIASKARTLFALWPEGSVLIDGEPVDQIGGIVLSDKPATVRVETPEGDRDVRIEKMLMREGSRESLIVMGGVPYPIPTEHDAFGLNSVTSVIAWVGMGEVNFAPNREALRMTPTTAQAIKAVHDHFDFAAQKAVQSAINACATAGEALRAMVKWSNLLPERLRKEVYSYRGRDLPARFKMPDGKKMTVISRHPRKLSSHSTYESIAADTAADAVWLYNYDRPSFTAGQRKKVNQWAESVWQSYPYGDVPEHFILVENMPQAEYLDKTRCYDWNTTVKPQKLPRSYSGGGGGHNAGRLAGSYDCWINGVQQYEVPADDIDTSEPIYYFMKRNRWEDRYDAQPYVNIVTYFNPGCTVVWLTSNRMEKFLRNFPEAQEVREACTVIQKEWVETLDEPTKALLAFHDAADANKFLALKPYGPFLDADIQATIDRLDTLNCPKLKKVIEEREVLPGRCGTFTTDWTDPITSKKYPLVSTSYYCRVAENPEHYALYFNAVAAATAAKELDKTTEAE